MFCSKFIFTAGHAARAYKKCVHMCAHFHAHMCTHSSCVQAVNTLASLCTCAHLHGLSLWTLHGPSLWMLHGMHACAYWPESSLLVHTEKMYTHMRTLACTHVYTFFVRTSSEDSGQCSHVCTHLRTLARVFTARTHKEWI